LNQRGLIGIKNLGAGGNNEKNNKNISAKQ
jgi:hypothetical protein